MLLTIDIGNTNITFGIFRMEGSIASKKIVSMWRMATDNNRTSDEYGTKILDFLHYALLNKKDITSAVAASVVPTLNPVLYKAAANYLKIRPIFVENEHFRKTRLAIRIDNPSEAGADRLLNALAAVELFGGPAAVIDFGTAVTFDCVNGKNEYIGGVILPGPLMAISALSMNTAKLPRVELKKPDRLIGKNTIGCIQSGIYFGYVGMMKRFISGIKKEMGARTKIIATGGLAPIFVGDIKEINQTVPELTLEGLRILWNTISR